MMMKCISTLLATMILASCSLAPTYHRPAILIPATYKENKAVTWLNAKPGNSQIHTKAWWQMYDDDTLNTLQTKLAQQNQQLYAALARYDEARAALTIAQAAFYPTILGVGNAYRQQVSGNIANKNLVPLYSDQLLNINLTYEVDVWGRVRNSVVAAKKITAASLADLMAIKLSLQALLADNYFALRGADALQKILDQTVSMYRKALYLTRKRYEGGAAPIADVDQAQTQFELARSAAADIRLTRAKLEHAIAVLIGEPPAAFALPCKASKLKFVASVVDLPSSLLERRPDIASAEWLVEAANAKIGVARAAFFPRINLSAGIGFESDNLSHLMSSPSLIWSLGPTTATALLNNGSLPLLTQVLLDGGVIRGLSDQALANYQETVANYRQTVLNAFQEVEDQLISLKQLNHEALHQHAAKIAAKRALQQAMYRYNQGLTTYLDVIFSQNIALQAELNEINIRTKREIASVNLVKALGGGWTSVYR